MKPLDDDLLTHVYLKKTEDAPWPPDRAFYLLSGDGPFFCRNEKIFDSSVPARRPPAELAPHQQFLRWHCPPIPQNLLEQAVGFFDWAHTRRSAESVVLVAWREATNSVELICPEQTATSYRNSYGVVFPETVRYEFPLPEDGLYVVGDLHSHCDMPAYASGLDLQDEAHFNGIHGVVGRLGQEPPQWHFEAMVDGVRFNMPHELVYENYQQRSFTYPPEWRNRHQVEYSGYLGPPIVDSPTRYYDYYDQTANNKPSTKFNPPRGNPPNLRA